MKNLLLKALLHIDATPKEKRKSICGYDHQDYCLTICHGSWLQHAEAGEYLRTEEAAKALASDEEFIKN